MTEQQAPLSDYWKKQLGLEETEELPAESPGDSAAYIPELAYSSEQVIPLMRQNLNFFAGTLAPLVFTFFFPPVLVGVWNWVLEYCVSTARLFPQLALGLPRGFAKTTLMKLIIAYVILFTKRRFILVVSETEAKAINIVADVVNMLSSANVVRLFGDWKLGIDKDQQALKTFGFRGRNIIIVAMGVGGSLRGYNIDNARPDFMLFDDIQSKEAAESQTLSEALENWFFGTALPAKSPMGCVFLFVANMYPTPNSLLRKLKRNATWTKFIAGAILSDGTSLWEELHPINDLLDDFEKFLAAGKPEIFYSEMMNDEEANMNNAIDLTKVPDRDYSDEYILGSFIVIDPATDKIKADAVSVGGFHVIEQVGVAWEVEEGRYSPGETCRRAIDMAIRMGATLIVVEGTAYQYSLKYWIDQLLQQYQITGITVLPIYPGGRSKNSRILSMFKQLVAGEIGLRSTVRSIYFHQISQFKPLRIDNSDGLLDLLTYVPKVLSEFSEYLVIQNPLSQETVRGASSLPYSEASNSEF